MKRPIFLIIGGAAAAALAAGLLGLGRDRGGEGALRLYGNVDIREVQLAFRQPGRIARMAFDEGDRVSAGQSMAALDAQPYQEALAVAEAQVQLARAELEKLRRGLRPQEIDQAREVLNQARALAAEAELDFQRQSGLLDSGASSRRTVDAARAAHERAAAGVKAAEAALSQAAEGFRREDIAAGEVLVEYTGEIISWQEAQDRHPHDPSQPNHTFYFHVDEDRVIDANYGGNSARWINHSCNPNCYADERDGRIFITALRNIQAGEELNYDYGLIIEERYTKKLKAEYPCWCGSKNCRGTLLAPKRGWAPPVPLPLPAPPAGSPPRLVRPLCGARRESSCVWAGTAHPGSRRSSDSRRSASGTARPGGS